jgi:hypothetical protein
MNHRRLEDQMIAIAEIIAVYYIYLYLVGFDKLVMGV